jgi:hypothetical protein
VPALSENDQEMNRAEQALAEEIIALIEEMLRWSEIPSGTNRRRLEELIAHYRRFDDEQG